MKQDMEQDCDTMLQQLGVQLASIESNLEMLSLLVCDILRGDATDLVMLEEDIADSLPTRAANRKIRVEIFDQTQKSLGLENAGWNVTYSLAKARLGRQC